MTRPLLKPRLHHVGVQTSDIANSIDWYQNFFGCRIAWTLDTFSPLTHSRLPGIVQLAEVVIGDARFHLFERDGTVADQDDSSIQFQHVCLAVDSAEELNSWRSHWISVRGSDRYEFTRDEPPTPIVTDADGTQSFYCFDVNGLEFEFTYAPEGSGDE
jgi:catechol 2,3-dioxygenase-like lactoylglutathione lyase family enzyme